MRAVGFIIFGLNFVISVFSMIALFNHLKSFLKIKSVCTDNAVFQLHYKFTAMVLIVCSILLTCSQFLGEPIHCIQKDDIPKQVLETFCWVHTTFTLPDAWNKKVGDEVAQPGIDKHHSGKSRKYHTYYQWVSLVLFLQGCIFYAPRYVWKIYENRLISGLILDLNSLTVKDKKSHIKQMVAYLISTKNHHRVYASCFILCEIFNFFHVVTQIFLIDKFLGGEFLRYGIEIFKILNVEQEYRTDPMVTVFPKMTKCTFHRYGSSGDVQKHDAFCLLPLNILNEKIYVFLWFWFVILALLSGMVLAYKIVLVFFPNFRLRVLKIRSIIASDKDLEVIFSKTEICDQFLLYLLCKNLDTLHFRDFVAAFALELKEEGGAIDGDDECDENESMI